MAADNQLRTATLSNSLPGSQGMADDAELILGAAPGGIYSLDVEARATLVNDNATRLLGFTAADLLGRRLHDVIHHTRPDGSPYPIDDCPVYRTLKDGRTRRGESEVFFRKDGTRVPVEVDCHPIARGGRLAGVLVTFRDVTERLQAEERTRQLVQEQLARARAEFQYAHLRDALDQAPALICVTRGPRHVIESANEQYAQATGRTDLVGKTIAEAFPASPAAHLEKLDQAYRTGTAVAAEEAEHAPFQAVGAGEQLYSFVIQPLRDESGTVYGLMTHAIDVTEQVRSRRALVSQNRMLARVAAALERSNRELDAFAYAASHDLRAPLRGIANLAQWIEEDLQGHLTDDLRQMLGLMRSRMHRMEALTEGLLQYSRAGRAQHEAVTVDTRGLVRDILDLLAPPPTTTIEVADDLPAVTSERLPLEQVLMNLIGNALKHAAGAQARITIGAADAGDFYEFSVSDNGPGIDPRFHERIWGIFQTLEARDKVEGTGIGLALVKKLTEAQGGRAWVESAPGAGATFTFLWRKSPLE